MLNDTAGMVHITSDTKLDFMLTIVMILLLTGLVGGVRGRRTLGEHDDATPELHEEQSSAKSNDTNDGGLRSSARQIDPL